MATHNTNVGRMQVGLVEGADLPLPPPEPFQSQHQERRQPIAQHQDQQLSQPPPALASEGDIVPRRPAQTKEALLPIPTKSYAVDDATVINLPAGESGANNNTGARNHTQGNHSAAVHTAGDHHRGEEGHPIISLLLGRFTVLHREGRLEEAAATLQQALDLMEKKRLKTARRKVIPRQDTEPPGGSSNVHEEGKAPYRGAQDSKKVESGEPECVGESENGNISVEHEVVAGDGLLESAAEASTIAGVMNDLGCTLQQVKEGWKSASNSCSPTSRKPRSKQQVDSESYCRTCPFLLTPSTVASPLHQR